MGNDYFDDTYTPGFTDPIDNRPTIDFLKDAHSQLRETMKEAYEPNKLKTQTEFEAICLMQLNNTAELDMPFVRIKARVPELHTMLPIPASITDYRAISLYPTYTCRNNDFEIKVVNGSVAPGTRMRVSYENMANFAGPKIIGISNILNLGADSAEASNRLAERRRQDRSNTAASGKRSVVVDKWCSPKPNFQGGQAGPGVILASGDPKPAGMSCGSSRAHLLNPVADEFEKLRQEVNNKGGIISSAGGYRSISALISQGRSSMSWHYTARAIDMAVTAGCATRTGDVRLDPCVVVRDPAHPKKWIVWAKVMNTAAPGAASVPNVTLNAFERNRGRAPKITSVTGKYFNLTDLFKKYGFERIPTRPCFNKGGTFGAGNYMCAEWWHFQNLTAGGGVPIGMTWGEVLLQQYSLEKIESSNYNKHSKAHGGVHPSLTWSEKATPWEKNRNKKYRGNGRWS